MRLVRASELPEHALVDLFNAGYSDYLLPMRLSTAAFAEHVAANDIDLECSRVVCDDQPAALALIARRDDAGWVGGMATVPEYRLRGLGAEAITAGLAALADRGASVAWLEVIDQNQRA
ncbi:MAG: GNAT family N-acetyltransferase, partial [Solirubrobacterales bacterium]